jgi:hypothetical protein
MPSLRNAWIFEREIQDSTSDWRMGGRIFGKEVPCRPLFVPPPGARSEAGRSFSSSAAAPKDSSVESLALVRGHRYSLPSPLMGIRSRRDTPNISFLRASRRCQ